MNTIHIQEKSTTSSYQSLKLYNSTSDITYHVISAALKQEKPKSVSVHPVIKMSWLSTATSRNTVNSRFLLALDLKPLLLTTRNFDVKLNTLLSKQNPLSIKTRFPNRRKIYYPRVERAILRYFFFSWRIKGNIAKISSPQKVVRILLPYWGCQ